MTGTIADFNRHAAECRRLAEMASTEGRRTSFLRIARQCDDLILELEAEAIPATNPDLLIVAAE
jgi:hypothetical protein